MSGEWASELEISEKVSRKLQAVSRLRDKHVFIEEGYDGEFGRIKLFSNDELNDYSKGNLFSLNGEHEVKVKKELDSIKFDISKFQDLYKKTSSFAHPDSVQSEASATLEQKTAIEHLNGVCIVLAGPGSGKTTILTERIIHLIVNHNVEMENILAITFSNEAAKEIFKRVNKILPNVKSKICTFHAFGLDILKQNYSLAHRREGFYIVSDADKIELASLMSNKKEKGVKKALKQISLFKQGVLSEIEDTSFFHSYEEELKRLNAIDIDDLIYLPVELFKTQPAVLEKAQSIYRWILIDEYQDINSKQYELIRLLAGDDRANLFVIGDPNQAIYSFRGSDTRFIEELKNDYQDTKIIKLSNSFRCPELILKAASQILKNDDYLKGKQQNIKINIKECSSDINEGIFISKQIETMIGGIRSHSLNSNISDGTSWSSITSFSDFAVLCRMNFLMEPIVEAFKHSSIPFQVINTEPFYNKEPLISIIRLLKKAFYKETYTTAMFDQVLLNKITALYNENRPISYILNTLMDNYEINEDDRKRFLQLTENNDNDYSRFFHLLTMRQGADDFKPRSEAVSIMTMHASKGLEFNVVFIPACEKGIIPLEFYSEQSADNMKEEERLFYVAATRSKQYLFLSYAKKRNLRGKLTAAARTVPTAETATAAATPTATATKSVFLERLEKNLLTFEKIKFKTPPKDYQLNLFKK
ncbi:UvrD/REP helicase [Candidatus Magnetoovum chiemensis]|nr:UvrD/REP helicase [Candidatus Magnetoovum chiemensis]